MPVQLPVSIERGSRVRERYAEWLQGYRWDYFATATFRQPRKEPYYALKHVWHELHTHSNVDRAFLVAEPFQSGDLHIHGLLAGDDAWRPYMELPWNIWQGLFDRFGRAKVETVNDANAVAMYCAKYLLKQQSRVCDYYEIFGNKHFWQNGKL